MQSSMKMQSSESKGGQPKLIQVWDQQGLIVNGSSASTLGIVGM